VSFDEIEDEEVFEGVKNLDDEVTKLERQDELPLEGKLDDLNREDLGDLPILPGANPADAQGMVVVTIMPCTLEEIEAIFIADNHAEIFPEVYDSYSREYTTSFDDYVDKKTNELEWLTTYKATLLGDRYTSKVTGEVRWIPEMDRKDGPSGPALYVRSVLAEPAKFVGDSNKSLSQDYQIDVYYEREPGRTVHMFADWREMNVGTFTTDDDMLINISLANFIEFDLEMAKHCGK